VTKRKGYWDVIVVGAGNAAHAAAVSACESGAERVLMLEKAPEGLRGGNTHYSGGLLRLAFDTPDALLRLIPDVQTEVPDFVAGVAPYPAEAFWSDLRRVTRGGIDPDLGELLVSRSFDTAVWMVGQGIRMEAAVSLAAIEFDGVVKWPSGAVVRTVDEGVGLSRMWFEVASRRGIGLRYQTGAQRLVQDRSGRISGVVVRDPDGISQLDAGSVVLACGGFEANPEWRARYLQRPWDMARVRGTAYNTGDGLRMALELGALPFGQWSGNHGTPIDADAPPFGDRHLTDKTNRLSYPLGVMVNTDGDRFIDEGEDFQLYTYAKTGGAILQQPGNVAYQIFDAKVTSLLEPRYVTGDPLVADTLDELIDKLPVGKTRLKESLIAYNAAVGEVPFDPTVHDGLETKGLTPSKSNWAQALDTPPFRAYPVTGGITFTFGGLRIDQNAQVLASDWTPIEGLYTCGEMVGGLFHHNYPGGSGLTSGAVFGRIAGRAAAESALP